MELHLSQLSRTIEEVNLQVQLCNRSDAAVNDKKVSAESLSSRAPTELLNSLSPSSYPISRATTEPRRDKSPRIKPHPMQS